MIRIAGKSKEEGVKEKLTVSASEAAEMLGISSRTLWGLTKNGTLPCIRAGRQVLYSLEILKMFANGELQGDRE